MSNTISTTDKQKARDQISADTEAFLKSGGEIKKGETSLTKTEKKYSV